MSTVNTTSSLDTDVIVVGAGVTGLVMAMLLSQQNFRVTVIEARDLKQKNEEKQPDPRALAITLASQRILSSIGVWPLIATDQAGQFRKMEVWDENGGGQIAFDCLELHQQTLGYIVESRVLQTALLQAATQNPAINWISPAQLGALDVRQRQAVLSLEDGRRMSASLIIAADGKHSSLRQLAEIGFSSHDYEQEALACIVSSSISHANTAWQRFLSDGTLAFLPMADPHQCGIVWSTRPEQVQALLKMEQLEFQQTLENAFESKLGKITASGKRLAYPLSYGVADAYVQARLALIGDAAHVVHPLAGQGANLGLLDAASLSEVLCEARSAGRDPGLLPVLRRYERWRKGENYFMMQMLTGFKQLFTSQSSPLPELRNLGLNVTNQLPFIKRRIMQYAMGLKGDLPDIARQGL